MGAAVAPDFLAWALSWAPWGDAQGHRGSPQLEGSLISWLPGQGAEATCKLRCQVGKEGEGAKLVRGECGTTGSQGHCGQREHSQA